ncbi:MAG: hypothetical protein WDW36_004030 [Sanguina aurantia]
MMFSIGCLVSALALLAPIHAASAAVAYTSAALADQVMSLPGLPNKLKSKMFSGYLQVDRGMNTQANFHYIFVESERSPSKDNLTLWLNGGPGCSSLLGFTAEVGPYTVLVKGAGMVNNPFAWSTVSNMLFLEAPAGVGFSYSNNTQDNTAPGDDLTATNNRLALLAFMVRFPSLAHRPFFISGESWAGHYIPQLATKIVLGNVAEPKTAIKLGGLVIGNPYITQANNDMATYTFFHNWGAISDSSYLAYTACVALNGGDADAVACYPEQDVAYGEVGPQSGIDPYNILAPRCLDSNQGLASSMRLKWLAGRKVERVSAADAAAAEVIQARRSQRRLLDMTRSHMAVAQPAPADPDQPYVHDPCVRDGTAAQDYLNIPAVQKALNMKPTVWVTCSNPVFYAWPEADRVLDLNPVYNALVASKVNMLIYSGDIDSVCPWPGVIQMSVTNNWQLANATVARRSWSLVDGNPSSMDTGGWVTEWVGGVSHATVRNAGHMVPYDQPEKALYVFAHALTNTAL